MSRFFVVVLTLHLVFSNAALAQEIVPSLEEMAATNQEALFSAPLHCPDFYSRASVEAIVQSEGENAKPGEAINFSGVLKNNNPYPLVDGVLSAKIFKRDEETAAGGDGHVVVDQLVIEEGVSLPANSDVPVAFAWQVPANADGGAYLIAYYFTIGNQQHFIGIPADDDVSATATTFSVDGDVNPQHVTLSKRDATINSTNYNFLGEPRTVAVDEVVTIETTVSNPSIEQKEVSVVWEQHISAVVNADSVLHTFTEPVVLAAGETRTVSYEVIPQAESLVYVKASLQDQDSKSILNIRLVRDGMQETRVKAAGVSVFPIEKGDQATLFACAGSTNLPLVPGNVLTLTLKDKEGQAIHEYTYEGNMADDLSGFGSEFTAAQDINYASLTATLTRNGVLIEEVTTVYDCAAAADICSSGDTLISTADFSLTKIGIALLVIALLLLAIVFIVFSTRRKKKNVVGGIEMTKPTAMLFFALLLPALLLSPVFPVVAQENQEEIKIDLETKLPINAIPRLEEGGIRVGQAPLNCFDYYTFGSVEADMQPLVASSIPGATLTFVGEVKNNNPYPIVDGALYVKIFKRDEAVFAAGDGNEVVDQFFVNADEQGVLKPISVAAQGTVPMQYEWRIPHSAEGGDYYAAYFFVTSGRYNLLGLSFTDDVVGNLAPFTVISDKGTASAKLSKTSTTINDKNHNFAAFPLHFTAGEPVTIKTTITNPTDEQKMIPLQWNQYAWDAMRPENLRFTDTQLINLGPGETKTLEYEPQAQLETVVYVTAVAQDIETKSILNIRYVQDGLKETRINFPGVTTFPLKKGQEQTLFACAHSTNLPVVSGNILTLTMKDKDGGVIHEYTYEGDISGDMSGFGSTFTPDKDFDYAVITARLEREGVLVEEVTLTYDCSVIDPNSCATTPNSSTDVFAKHKLTFISLLILLLVLTFLVFFIKKRRKQRSEGGVKMTIPLGLFFLALMLPGLFLMDAATAEAKSVNWSSGSLPQLMYHWNWGGAIVMDSGTSGWQPGLAAGAVVNVTYQATLRNADTGVALNDGAVVAVGTRITYSAPYSNADISWNGTGLSSDSPNGRWIANAGAPGVACDPADRVADLVPTGSDCDTGVGFTFPQFASVHIPLSVHRPAESFTGNAQLTQESPTVWRVTSGGALQLNITFPATYGRFYYRYDTTGQACYDWGCVMNNVPMVHASSLVWNNCGYTFMGTCYGSYNPTPSTPYNVNVPQQTISFNLTATQPNSPPTVSITGPVTGTVGTPYNFPVTASDPNNDQVKTGVYSNSSCTSLIQWLPGSGFVNSGTVQNYNRSFATAGTYYIYVKAEDNQAGASGCQQHQITISPAIPTCDLLVNGVAGPVSVNPNSSVTLSWNNSNITSATKWGGTWGSGNALTPVLSGSQVTTLGTSNVTYTIQGSNGSQNCTDSVTVNINDLPPDIPVLNVGACTVGQPVTANFSSSDQNGHQIYFEINWTGSGANTRVPGSGYAASGNASYTYGTAGPHTVYVRAIQDNPRVLSSGWATRSVTCAVQPAGQCGTSHTGTFSPAPSSNLCTTGTVAWTDQFPTDRVYNWSCNAPGGNASCWANVPNVVPVTAVSVSACVIGQPVTGTAVANDPEGSRLVYDLVWYVDNTGAAQIGSPSYRLPQPWGTYALNNTPVSATYTFTSPGPHRVSARAIEETPGMIGQFTDRIFSCTAAVSCGSSTGGSFTSAPSSNLCSSGGATWYDQFPTDGVYNWSCGAMSCTANVQPATPGAPTVTPQACGTNQLFLDWPDAANAVSYSIYHSSGAWVGNSIGSNYTFTGSASTAYTFYVRANSASSIQSGNSPTGSGTTPAGSCAGVCGASVNMCTSGSYADVTDSGTHYLWSCGGTACSLPQPSALLEARVNGGAWSAADRTINVGDVVEMRWSSSGLANCTSYNGPGLDSVWTTSGTDTTITEPAAGTYSDYNLTCNTGSTVRSDDLRITTNLTVLGQPAPPTVTPGSCGSGQITASWGAISGATSYDLQYRQTGSSGAWTFLAGATSPRTVSSLSAGVSYDFQLRANNAAGNSAWSGYGTVSAPAACPTTVNLNASNLTYTGTAQVGQTIQLTGGVMNNGTGNTPTGFTNIFEYRIGGSGVFTQIYLAPSAVLNASASRGEGSGAFVIPAGASGQTLYLQYCVDHGNVIAETNETVADNCRQINVAVPVSVSIPATPTGLSATPGACSTGAVSVTWNSVSGATSYQLRNSGGTIIYNGPATSFSHTGLTAGSLQYYTVRATNSAGSSAYSGTSAGTNAPVACPLPPSAPTVTAGSCGGQLNVSWSNVTNATGYDLQYRQTGSSGAWTALSNVTSPRSVSGLTVSTLYDFQVRAKNGSYNSAWSSYGTGVSSGTCVTPPATPTGLTATPAACGTGLITVTWNSSVGATSYELSINGAAWQSVGNVVSYNHSGLPNGTPYSYRVRATNSAGSSAQSTIINQTSPSACAVPTATITAPNCVIPAGASSCLVSVTWSSSNTTAPLSVRQNSSAFSTLASSGGTSRTLTYGSHSFTFHHNSGVQLASDGATASCTGGTAWNGSVCASTATINLRANTLNYSGSVQAGQSITLTGVALNNGTGATPSGFTDVFEYRYGASGGFTQLSTEANAVLAAGGSNTDTSSAHVIPAGMVGQTLYVQYCIDSTGVIAETDETLSDNCRQVNLGVVSGVPVPTASIGSGSCTIASGASTCTSVVTWSSSNTTAPLSMRQAGSEFSTAANNAGGVSRTISYPSSSFTFHHNSGTQLASRSHTATCTSGTSWNGSVCAVAASASINAPDCTVTAGNGTCTSVVSWSSSNTTAPHSVQQNGVYFSNGASHAGVGLGLTPGSHTFTFSHNNGVQLASDGATATCAGGTTWNGVICAAPTPSATISAPNCTILTGNSSCTSNVSWNSSNTSGGLSVRHSGSEFSTTGSSGGTSRTLAFGSHTFTFHHNGGATQLATDGASAACSASDVWNGTVCAAVPANPGLTITSDKSLVRNGDTATITWSVTTDPGTLTCRVLGPGINENPSGTSGTRITNAINARSEFRFTCTDGTNSWSDNVFVDTTGRIEET